ncbi:MAG: carboxypeptidase regulatory-like domain-containing protein, partial [Anaerolineales bacterium]
MTETSDGYSSIHLGHKRIVLAAVVALVLLLVASTVVVLATQYNILTQGTFHKIGDAVYRGYNPAQATGSGTFYAFVRISDANKNQVEGYNTTYRPLEFDENTSPSFTREILLSDVPVTTDPDYPGIYREFQLDINQTAGSNLSLDEVEVYLTLLPNITGYPFATAPNTATLVYELDAGGANHNVVLNYDLAAGSGKRDMILRIPDSHFQGVPDMPYCEYKAATCSTYVVLYSQFGGDSAGAYPNDDGFEEWGVEIYELATKSGYKFNDWNANGNWDGGEPGLSGWRIYLDVNGNGQYDAGEPYDDTDPTGQYTITNIVPNATEFVTDTWTIREVTQTNWLCSHPDPCYYEENFAAGAEHLENDFGNYQPPGYKFGYKYEDLDADGDIVEDTANPLSGWTISVLKLDNTFVVSDTTSATGYYSFTLAPGEYKVCEDVESGWTQSYPTIDHPEYVACPNGTAGYSITVTSNTRLGPNDFGNWTTATKSGYKYEDMDGDGNIAEDTGNPLDNWTIKVFDTGGSEVASTTTNASGYYSFTLNPGSYRVCEDLEAGWTQSYPTSGFACANGTTGYSITLQSGDHDRENNFGNYVK